jgi:uncharacterized protein YdeI (YjbR/CyaY-like superfamily)
MNPNVDFYFTKAKQWQTEIETLRSWVLDCGLNEELKWGCPCYTSNGSNIVLIHVFKEYCALLFFKGALLSNKHGLLIQQTPNVQVARQLRFTSLSDIVKQQKTIKACIKEAIAVEQAGVKVEFKASATLVLAEELQALFAAMPALKKAFLALTPGRQRAYNLYFTAPKQAKTREARIEKYIPQILNGKGLND